MPKLIRFDEEYFGYLVERNTPRFTAQEAHEVREVFELSWPGKTLIVMQADEFIDLTGQYEIVPIPDATVVAR